MKEMRAFSSVKISILYQTLNLNLPDQARGHGVPDFSIKGLIVLVHHVDLVKNLPFLARVLQSPDAIG